MIKNETIQRSLEKAIAFSHNGTKDQISFWVGGYKRDDKWFWEDFSEIVSPGGFTNWAINRSNNHGNGLIISSMQSRHISGLNWTSLDWYNEDETSSHGYICERGMLSMYES